MFKSNYDVSEKKEYQFCCIFVRRIKKYSCGNQLILVFDVKVTLNNIFDFNCKLISHGRMALLLSIVGPRSLQFPSYAEMDRF